jgi:muramidase (phage lysozyme)/peptidoglycan hydrolase-like protein with peptidoglycan-binding domain
MAYSLTWLPKVLRDAGLKVAEVDGWETRGRGDIGPIKGVMCHHTGTQAAGVMPTLRLLINGRTGKDPLNGPLCQLGLARDGSYIVVAAGKANHAGLGQWRGFRNNGNSGLIGIEAENSGLPGDKWPDYQMDAYRRGVAAILKHLGLDADCCIGHKEYAPTRKIDPSFDMDVFRAGVRAVMNGTAADIRPPVKAVDPVTGRRTLARGAIGEAVGELQRALGLVANCSFDVATEVAVRQFQRLNRLRDDGVVGPMTWAALFDHDANRPVLPGAAVPVVAPAGDAGLPEGARILLDFIASYEAPKGYDTLYGNNQLPSGGVLTGLTLGEVIKAGPFWSRLFGSSACGRYQFMTRTLRDLSDSLKLSGTEQFSPAFQDWLGFKKLNGRGYTKFKTGKLTLVEFGKALAQEWAALPVLEPCQGNNRRVDRGQSYYAGDGLNRALVEPKAVEEVLQKVSAAAS